MRSEVRVLFVDDESSVCMVFQRTASDAGYRVDVATTAPQAVEQARVHDYDLVLVDLVLAEYNGLDVLQDIAPIQPAAGLILISAQFPSDGNMRIDGRDVYVLAKPWEPEAMLSLLEQTARSKQAVVAAIPAMARK